jgi:NAD(P)-dependent dehydrogenase (short-subunit alcohol dehydrogenase family)
MLVPIAEVVLAELPSDVTLCSEGGRILLASAVVAQAPPSAQNIIPDGISFATEGTLQALDPGAGTLTIAPKDQTPIPMTVAPGVSLAGIEQGDFASIHYTRTVTFMTGNKATATSGAGTGIGRATARAMAANGAKVVVAELNAAAGEQTAQIISQAGGHCIAITTDVSEEDSVRAAIDTAVGHYGGLHVLHNNAGGSTPADNTVVEAPIQEFWRAIRLDLFGTFLGCRFGIPAIIASGGGSVINMASNVAPMGVAGLDCYTAAKGGIAAITRSMAVEFAPQKVRVNAIAPAATMTDRVRTRFEAGNPRVTKIAAAHLIGLIEPEDIANMAVFLASDESRMITGHVCPVDSGITVS